MMLVNIRQRLCVFLFVSLFLFSTIGFAQTSTITYQGSLNDGAMAASGTYEMQFSLYGSSVGNDQIGATITDSNVQVIQGVFTVRLNFTAPNAFDGSSRWLEIRVRKSSDPPGFTTLAPRQQITSSPYSIRTLSAGMADSLSSACSGCVTDSHINSLAASKITGTVASATNAATATTAGNVTGIVQPANGGTGMSSPGGTGNFLRSNGTAWTSSSILAGDVPSGSGNYIQNKLITATPAQTGDFYITGSGRIDSRFFVGGGTVLTGERVAVTGSSLFPWSINGYTAFNGGGVYGSVRSGTTNFGAVQGEYSGTSVNGAGVRGIAINASSVGVFGVENTGIGWAGFFNGDVGTPAPFNYYVTSSRKIKTNIRPIGSAVGSLTRLNGYVFDMNPNYHDYFADGKNQLGLVAEEVEEIFPSLVKEKNIPPRNCCARGQDTTLPAMPVKSVNYIGLIPVLIEAVKQQQRQIDAQAEQIQEQNKLIEQQQLNEQKQQLTALQEQVKQQQAMLEAMRKMLCVKNPGTEVCQ